MKKLELLRWPALVAAAAGALGSVALLLRAGQRSGSILLLMVVTGWVLSPFGALVFADRIAGRWSGFTRAMLHGLSLMMAAGSLAIYGAVAPIPAGSRTPFSFLMVPLGSWLLLAIVIPLAAVLTGRVARWRPLRWLIKAVAMSALFGVLAIGGLLGLLLLDHNQDTVLPTPTGPFAVGRATAVWSDASHVDSLAPQPGTKRELFAWIWYPTAPPQPSQSPDEYLPAAWRAAFERLSGVLLTEFLTRDLARVHAHGIRDAEVSPKKPAYPVVLMRAGLAAPIASYTSLAEDLASHGYVVVGFDAPYRSFAVVFPDGRVIARADRNNADLVSGAEQEQLATTLVSAWSADMSFALDQLERLNTSDPTGMFKGRLDLQRVGVFGHSLGGATALQFCHDDARCKTGIDVDGAPFGSVIGEGVRQPVMFLMSDHGREAEVESRPVLANIRAIYDKLPADRRLQITIRGAGHFGFSDDGALLKSPMLMRVLRTLGIVRLDGRRQLAITADCIRRFFDAYLQGAPVAGLRGMKEWPEVQAGE